VNSQGLPLVIQKVLPARDSVEYQKIIQEKGAHKWLFHLLVHLSHPVEFSCLNGQNQSFQALHRPMLRGAHQSEEESS